MPHLSTETRSAYIKLRAERRKILGLCNRCPNKALPNRTRCLNCQQKLVAKNIRRVKARTTQVGISPLTTRNRELKAIVMANYGPTCKKCNEGKLECLTIDHINNDGGEHRKFGGQGGSNFYRSLIRNGFPIEYQCLCWNCNYRKAYSILTNGLKPTKQRMYRQRLKLAALKAYGENCVCGIDDQIILTIDHINGGGNAHRRSLRVDSVGFYRWLRDNNYPTGFRTLCFNCNCGKKLQSVNCVTRPILAA